MKEILIWYNVIIMVSIFLDMSLSFCSGLVVFIVYYALKLI